MASQLIGYIDRKQGRLLSGWLYSPEHQAVNLVFDLFLDGRYEGQSCCAYFRDDLRNAGLGHGGYGFHAFTSRQIKADSHIELFISSMDATWLEADGDGKLVGMKHSSADRRKRTARFTRKLLRDVNISDVVEDLNEHSKIAHALNGSEIYAGQRYSKLESSDFCEFIRRKHNFSGNDRDFYKWYIEEYIVYNNLYPAILSDAELNFIRREFYKKRWKFNPKSGIVEYSSRAIKLVLQAIVQPFSYSRWRYEFGPGLKLATDQVAVGDAPKLRSSLTVQILKRLHRRWLLIQFARRRGGFGILQMLFTQHAVRRWVALYAEVNPIVARFARDIHFHGSKVLKHSSATAVDAGTFGSTPASSERRLRVQIVGPFDKIMGLGESCRRLSNVFDRAVFDVRLVNYDLHNLSPNLGPEFCSISNCQDVNIFHLNLDEIPEFLLRTSLDLSNSFNVAFPYWELNDAASVHKLGAGFIDEIWVASSFLAKTFDSLGKRIERVGIPAKPIEIKPRELRSNADFTFFCTFDALSWPQRKNTELIVRAFQAAFKNGEAVRLIVKTHNASTLQQKAQIRSWSRILASSTGDPRIELIDRTLDAKEFEGIFAACDCLVSLHRAEGLGLDILDALASGISVIATGYSGNMDLCTADNSWLVDYDLVSVPSSDYVFVERHHVWAEPRLESAVRQLQSVVRDPVARKLRAERGKVDSGGYASPSVISKRIVNRLNEI